MINKSTFEDELISGMQRELRSQATDKNVDHLEQAADYLSSAMEILEEAGMHTKANAILGILTKIAQENVSKKKNPLTEMPSMQALMEAGLTQRDLTGFSKGDPVSKAKVNQILRNLGRTDKEIMTFLGKHNFMSEDTAETMLDPNRNLGKMWDWMKNPSKPMDTSNPQAGEEISFRSLPLEEPKEISMQSLAPQQDLSPGKDLTFKSMAQMIADEADARKHKIPSTSKLNDPHIKNLTPEKMISNLKNHGTVFNMSDDGNDDLLNAEVTDELDVSEADAIPEMDFEDEI